MADESDKLRRAARQLIETEELLGGSFIPSDRAAASGAQPAGDDAARQQKAKALAELDAGEVRICRRCGLAGGRTNTVFGEGNPDAEVVFVGEGPGQEEDLTGRPFVGRAGELLTKMIQAMGLKREDVYICNVIKCRAPNNRVPNPEEAAACWDYLVRQLQIIGPKVIVTLGNPATQALLRTRTGITRLRGQWQSLPLIGEGLEGTAVMPTFHPAFVLRQYTEDVRGKVWSDLQEVMARLGLPLAKRSR